MSLYTKQLLNEIPCEDTVHDWVYGPQNGFLRYIGKAQQYLIGRAHPKGSYDSVFSIPFHTNNTNSMIIRFPAVGILSILGFNAGVYGAVKFARLYAKRDKISALYFVLSNSFFSATNAAGLIYHCILPNDFIWRYIFRYIDQISTGLAGVFMGFALQSIHTEINNENVILYVDENENENDSKEQPNQPNGRPNSEWHKEKHKIYSIIGSAVLLPIIHPIFGDIIYISGVLVSVYNLLQCHLKLTQYDEDDSDNELKDLKTMSKTALLTSAIAGIGVLGAKQIALWTNGKLNLMRTMFMFSDIGYMFTLYYGIQQYNDK